MTALRSLPPWASYVLQGLVLTALAVLLFRTVDWAEAVRLVTGARPMPLIAAALMLTLQTLLSALRWRLTASRLGIALPIEFAIREYYLSQVVNQSLPGGVLGDAGRAIRARGAAGLMASGQAVIFERVAGQLGLLSILIAALAINAVTPGGLSWPAAVQNALWVALGIGLIGAIALFLLNRSVLLGRSLLQFHHAVLAGPVLAPQVVLSLGTAFCNIAAFALCAAAIGAPLPPVAAAALVPMILFAMVLPLSISGWGLREGAAALLFPVAGLSASAGLAASVAFGLTFLAITLPGLLMLRRGPDLAEARRPEPDP
ncbi:UPF0104 family protein [Rhodobacterales bacterium HKCCE4037]|nr:UPF0104 family protein [Rhodobacterales bacterium HKCCE4037]